MITTFEVRGNRATRMHPDERINIIVSAEAQGSGTFFLAIEPQDLAFVSNWDSKSVECSTTCTLTDTLTLSPTAEDCGVYSLKLIAQIRGPNGNKKWEKDRMLTVVPNLVPEPAFTPGTANEICWQPFDAVTRELMFFPENSIRVSPFSLFNTAPPECKAVEGLAEKQKYGFYLETTLDSSGQLISLNSDTLFSTQDNTPPPEVSLSGFTVDADGRVTLRWPFLEDETSRIAKYLISRTQLSGNGQAQPFVLVDSLNYFPVFQIAPADYQVTEAGFASQLYVDANEAITRIPPELSGLTMIQTAIADRWREEEDFLSFTLPADSHVYLAMDKNTTPVPEWVGDDFQVTGLDLQTTRRNGRGYRVFRSRDIFPAGEVVLGGNFAPFAETVPSAEPRTYVVFIEPVSGTFPFEMGQEITFTDALGEENDLKTFQYRIDAVDAAGNLRPGADSPPIILDLQGQCRPELATWFDFETQGRQFAQGARNTICIQDPGLDAACVNFRSTDSLRFQAVRENVALFERHSLVDEGEFFFDSDWLSVADLPQGTCFEFDLLPQGGDLNSVNDETYFYRVQAKDRFNNISSWSDTVSAIQDAFPPGDIPDLSAQTRPFEHINDGCIDLSWSPATDPVSGINAYTVFRSDDNGASFQAVATIAASPAPTYCDTLSSIGHNGFVQYRIGSVDNVGNVRSFSETEQEVTVQTLNGPFLSVDTTQVIFCHTGAMGVRENVVTVLWNFSRPNVAAFELEIEQPTGTNPQRVTIPDPAARRYDVPFEAGDGLYRIRIRAIYADGRRTVFSNTVTVKHKTVLAGVVNLAARHEPIGTGDVILSWSHPDSLEIDQYRVFAWPEGEAMPDAPTALLPRDSTQWVHEFGEQGIAAYQCTNYLVEAIDCFGLVSQTNPGVRQYSNRRPTFDERLTEIVDDDITVCWQRPSPRALADDAFEATVLVYRDSLRTVPDTVRVFNDTCITFFDALPQHNYIFVVQERLLGDPGQSCSEVLQSAASRPLTVPFDNQPVAVDFIAQPLPVLPDANTGRVFLAWDTPADTAVSRFLVRWDSESTSDEVQVANADTFLVSGLDVTQSYRFQVIAADSLGQLSENNRIDTVNFQPRWRFTPRPMQLRPTCFRDDVRIEWAWVDENLQPVSDNFGADSVFIEISIDPDFELRKTTAAIAVSSANAFTFAREDYPFVNVQNTTVFVRMRARDRWNHFSPWSTEYAELGMLNGEYDEIPPPAVTAVVDSVKAPAFGGAETVNVHLRWNDVADNCSGTWFYEIRRNDEVVGRDSSDASIHGFVDRRVPADGVLLESEWQIHAVDSVGNRQTVAPATGLAFFLTPPDSAWCQDDTTFCWSPGTASIAGVTPSYIIEGARFPELLGVPGANVLAGPLDTLCYNFEVPWENIYWRIKARADNFESAWSDTFFCNVRNGLQVSSVEGSALGDIPKDFKLEPNYPNPFNPSTTIQYAIPRTETGSVRVVIDLFNTSGQRIRSLVDAQQQPGWYSVVWDGRDDHGRVVGSGVYFYRIRAGEFIRTRKLTLLK